MKLTVNTYFNDQDGKFICEKYFIDGEECSEEEYDDILDEFDDENIENEADCCDCYECTINRYVEYIQEITGGCGGCIREVLESFADEIIDHIVIEDAETDEIN